MGSKKIKEQSSKYDYTSVDRFIKTAKECGYEKPVIELAIMFCCTKNAVQKCGSEEKALDIATDLCAKISDADIFLSCLGKKLEWIIDRDKRKSKNMVKLKLKEINEEKVSYYFYPEGGKKYGIVSYTKKDKKIEIEKECPGVTKLSAYNRFAIKALEDCVDEDNFKNEIMMAWY